MLAQPVVDVLAALNVAGVKRFNKVAGAADFAAARDDLKSPPAAYVVPLNDMAQPNMVQGMSVEQHITERFGVILAVRNAADVRGDKVNGALETLRSATIQALLGIRPAADYDPVQYSAGRLLLLDVTTTWWQLEFTTGYYERKV